MIKHTFCVKISTTFEKVSRDLFRDFLNMKDADPDVIVESFEYWTTLNDDEERKENNHEQ